MSTLTDPAFLAMPTMPYEEFLREKVAFDRLELEAEAVA